MVFLHPAFRKQTLDCTLCSIRIDLIIDDVLGKQVNHHKIQNFTGKGGNLCLHIGKIPLKLSGQGLAEVVQVLLYKRVCAFELACRACIYGG